MASISSLVPELLIAHSGESVLLPENASGAVETWRGNGGFEAYGYEAAGSYWAQLPGLAVYRFDDASSDVVAIPDAAATEGLVRDAYYRGVLPLVLQLRGHEVLHASAVETQEGLLVLCGVSGSGKSTFADRLSRRGYPIWADDAVVLDFDGDGASALSVPFRLRVHGDTRPEGKRSRPTPRGDDARSQRSPLLSLVLLDPVDEPATASVEVTRLGPGSAFTALLPHAYFFHLADLERNSALVRRYLRLASSVSSFEVRYRRDLGLIESVLDELERHVVLAAR